MRKIFTAIAGVSMLGFAAGASASELPSAEQAEEPVLLTAMEMDGVTAGLLNLNIAVLEGFNVSTINQIAVLSRDVRQRTNVRQSIRQRVSQNIN